MMQQISNLKTILCNKTKPPQLLLVFVIVDCAFFFHACCMFTKTVFFSLAWHSSGTLVSTNAFCSLIQAIFVVILPLVGNYIVGRDGVVVRALASHQCGLGSNPGPDVIRVLSLCWFSSLLRGFFSGFSGFPPSPKTNIQLIPAGCKLCSKVTHGPYSGCQRRHCKLSVWPCWAASLLYFATAISGENLCENFWNNRFPTNLSSKCTKPSKQSQRKYYEKNHHSAPTPPLPLVLLRLKWEALLGNWP